jgi:hypothetical protein
MDRVDTMKLKEESDKKNDDLSEGYTHTIQTDSYRSHSTSS